MFRLKMFRSHAPWAACLSLLVAACLTWSPSIVAQQAGDEEPAPADVQPAEDAPVVPPADASSDGDAQPPVDAADEPKDETPAEAGDESKPADSTPADLTPAETKPADDPSSDSPAEQPVDAAESDVPTISSPATDPPEAPESAPAEEEPASAPDAAKKSKRTADVSAIPVEDRFRLVDAMRNQDDRITPAEYEQARKEDIDLTPAKEFEELDIDKNQSLTIDEFVAGFDNMWILAAIIVATLALPFVAAIYLCRWLRLPEYSTRMGFVLVALTASIVVVSLGELRFGIDLRGGVILVYAVDEAKTEQLSNEGDDPEGDYMERLIAALNLRVNPGGQKEIVIRKFGEQEVEIIVPEAQPAEIEQLKKTIRTAGFLEFRIMANTRNIDEFLRGGWEEILKDASKPESGRDVKIAFPNLETQEEEEITVARWFPIDPVQVDLSRDFHPPLIKRKNAEGEDEVLAVVRDPYREREWVVRGNEISSAGQDRDNETGEPAVTFRMTAIGSANLGEMTGEFAPEDKGNFHHRMGIIFDGRLISAPGLREVITSNGQISGSYTKQDISAMVNVLNAGSLPAVLIETPVSQNEIGATVGEDTIRKGRLSMIVATSLVLLFMAAFYRFSGVVACCALLLNILITVAVIILFKAPLTLPGLAGLALGVGMAVDANVLIFERIREELDRGAALRMAIRNGFDRATTTIVDSNLTTVITGLVLYWIGTDQVKGFAITLIIGIVANLFTAITAVRLVFDIADKKRMLSKLSMSRVISGTKFDFIGKRRVCIGASIVLIIIGLGATFSRGITLLDIDFAGGTSADVVFVESKRIDDIREILAERGVLDPTVSLIHRDDGKTVQFKIDTSLGNPSSLPIEFANRDADGDGKLTPTEYVHDRKGRSAEFAQSRFVELDVDEADGYIDEDEFAISREDVLYYFIEGIFGDKLRRNTLEYSSPEAVGSVSAWSGFSSPFDGIAATASPPRSPIVEVGGGERLVRLASYQAEPAGGEDDGEEEPLDVGAADAADGQPADGQPADEPSTQDSATDSATDAADTETSDTDTSDTDTSDTDTDAKPDTTSDADAPPDADPATTDPATDPATTDPANTDPAKPDASSPPADGGDQPASSGDGMQTSTTLTFGEKVSYKQVHGAIDLLVEDKFPSARTRITHAAAAGSQEATTEWVLETSLSSEETTALLDAYRDQLASEPVFPAASSIGPQVAEKAKQQAVFAIVVSLLAIIVYVWIRFQKVVYGLAAVVALAHDVLITLGIIALSSYFAESVPGLAAILQIDPFKINLTVVAAFLTIIGFSINDTIVIFDRLRETRGKSPYLTADMVNLSVNQMLGRTILTSATLLLVVVILYFFGGEAIHGFAFAMLVGVMAGVYSSVYIANPIVLWMSAKPEPTKSEVRSPAQVA